jgi:hypothetical protein
LLPDFEVIEESTNVGEEQVADLGLLLERRLNFREGILEVPVFAGKGKRGPDLFEARRVLTVGAQPRAIGREPLDVTPKKLGAAPL